MQFICEPKFQKATDYELVVLPFWQDRSAASAFSFWQEFYQPPLLNGDFRGKMGESLVLYQAHDTGRVLLLGLGPKEGVTAEHVRRAYAAAVRVAKAKKVSALHLYFPLIEQLVPEDVLYSMAEGMLLTNYHFTRLKSKLVESGETVLLNKFIFFGVEREQVSLLERCNCIVSGVHSVRNLVNGNADEINPQMLAHYALSIADKIPDIKGSILNKEDLEKENMGLLLAVNRGSCLDPHLIKLEYKGDPDSDKTIVLIGKGVTYDTGGLSLKPSDNMVSMKCDMSGAATVLVTIQIAALLNLKVNVTALAPVTENSIDAKSYKLGDVYQSMSGKTVEITNTDAEGRLILADALTYAQKYLHPTMIIDVASLTGGIVVALGEDIAGLFSNNDYLAHSLRDASQLTGELLWRMPLHSDYKEMLKSDVADIINSCGRTAAAMTAALFLQEFCETVPWAHIDFAGSCYLSKPRHYNPTKATGFGLRLLIRFLEQEQA